MTKRLTNGRLPLGGRDARFRDAGNKLASIHLSVYENTSSNQRLVECVRQDTRKDSEARGAEAHGMALTSFAPEKFSGGAKLPTSYSP